MLDASALLAYLNRERGMARVRSVVSDAAISTVNLAEVLSKATEIGLDAKEVMRDIRARGVSTVPFLGEDAEFVADLWRPTRSLGLSLGDRACLALGFRMRSPVLTADAAWAGLRVGVEIRVIR